VAHRQEPRYNSPAPLKPAVSQKLKRKLLGNLGAGSMFSFEDRVAVPTHVLVRVLDGESVLLNVNTERYYGLDHTGTRMWQLLTESPNIDAAYQSLLAEFDAEPERLRSDLSELLARLVDNGLLEVQSDVGTAPAI
jgi:Coenzyme PQQ synthesis protein D (PqqD)